MIKISLKITYYMMFKGKCIKDIKRHENRVAEYKYVSRANMALQQNGQSLISCKVTAKSLMADYNNGSRYSLPLVRPSFLHLLVGGADFIPSHVTPDHVTTFGQWRVSRLMDVFLKRRHRSCNTILLLLFPLPWEWHVPGRGHSLCLRTCGAKPQPT